jgi:hypothetical protein
VWLLPIHQPPMPLLISLLFLLLLLEPAGGIGLTIILAQEKDHQIKFGSLFLGPILTMLIGFGLMNILTGALGLDLSTLIPIDIELFVIQYALFFYYPILILYLLVKRFEYLLPKENVRTMVRAGTLRTKLAITDIQRKGAVRSFSGQKAFGK